MFHSTLNLTKTLATVGLALALSLYPVKLAASPITWSIEPGTTLSHGATVSGSFVYDASLSGSGAYSSANIVLGDDTGISIAGDTYTTILGSSYTSVSGIMALDLGGNTAGNELDLVFENPLPGAGGTAAYGMNFFVNGTLVDHESPGNIAFNAEITSTPEPRAALLMLLGIIGVIGAGGRSSFAPVLRFCRPKR